MADILIRGMDMPKDCGHCRFAVDGWCYAYGKPNITALANDGITNFCPLVPLPEGHGGLVDARELLHDNEGLQLFKGDYRLAFDRIIERANTIVPAEGGSENG